MPSKHLQEERALLVVGSEVLRLLNEPKTVSRLWDDLKRYRQARNNFLISYDWYILSLDMLYALGVINLDQGRLLKVSQ